MYIYACVILSVWVNAVKMPASVSQPSSQAAATAGIDAHNWSLINEELATMISPLHSELANDIITPSVAAEEFASLVGAHLEHRCALKKSPTQSTGLTTNGHNRERAAVRLTKRLAKLKNQSRRTFPHNPSEFPHNPSEFQTHISPQPLWISDAHISPQPLWVSECGESPS